MSTGLLGKDNKSCENIRLSHNIQMSTFLLFKDILSPSTAPASIASYGKKYLLFDNIRQIRQLDKELLFFWS